MRVILLLSTFLFFILYNFFFFFNLVALDLSCGMQCLCVLCGNLVAMHRLSGHGASYAAHRLLCSMVCRIMIPRPGIEPVSPVLQGEYLTTGPPRKSLHSSFLKVACIFLPQTATFVHMILLSFA